MKDTSVFLTAFTIFMTVLLMGARFDPFGLTTVLYFTSALVISITFGIGAGKKYEQEWSIAASNKMSQEEIKEAKELYRKHGDRCNTCGKKITRRVNNVFCSYRCNGISNQNPSGVIMGIIFIVLGFISLWLLLLGYLLIAFAIWTIERDTEEYRYKRLDEVKAESIANTETSLPMKYVEELDESFRVCCYQTARLNEMYCQCGLTVPQKLQNFIHT